MPIHKITHNGIWPVIYKDKDTFVDTSTWNLSGDRETVSQALKDNGQKVADTLIPLAELSVSDPNRLSDPNTINLFWDGKGNLVERLTVVTQVFWDGSKYQIGVQN